MELDIDVNLILRDVITKVDNRLQPCRTAEIRFPDARLQLFKMIDAMGEASARAQNLPGAITTGRKLEMSDHHLYIMKDSEGSRGRGAVVGILKMGRKRLFVYDRHGQQWEMSPLCVLDFYVHESRQRMGCGRRLFDFMLKNENTVPQHLAVDRPSLKFSSFLAKHYGLKNEIPQVNNFVIFDGFFTKRSESDFIHNKRNMNDVKPADYTEEESLKAQWHRQNYNGMVHHYQPGSTAAGLPSILPRHQNAHHDKVLRELNINPRSAHVTQSGSPEGLSDMELRSVSAGSGSHRGVTLPLHSAMYSRHQTADINPNNHIQGPPGTNNRGSGGRPPSGNKVLNRPPSGKRSLNRPPSGDKNLGRLPNVAGGGSGGGDTELNTSVTLEDCGKIGLIELPSTELCEARSNPMPENGHSENSKFEPVPLPNNLDIENHDTVSNPPANYTASTGEPPLLPRDGLPQNYLDSFNLHQNYQGRAGHLAMPPDPRMGLSGTNTSNNASNHSSTVKETNIKATPDSMRSANGVSNGVGYYTRPSLYSNGDTSWTVLGVLRNQNHTSARYSGHSRLW